MTIGTAIRTLGGLLLGLGLMASCQASEWGIDPLLAAIAAGVQEELGFVEERHDALLGVPLRSEGRLQYRAPDYLAKYIEQGGSGSFVLQGDTLRATRRGSEHELELDSHPALRALAVALRASLGGDRAALEQYFVLSLTGTPAAWQLRLQPHEAAVERVMSRMQLDGQGGQLQQITIHERSGNHSVMSLRYPDDD